MAGASAWRRSWSSGDAAAPPCRPAAASPTSRSSPSRRAPGRATPPAASRTSSAGDVASLDDLVARTPAEFRDEHRIDVRLRHEVARHRPRRPHASRCATTPASARSPSSSTSSTSPPAPGPTRPDLPGIDLDHVRGVQTLDDAKALLDHARVVAVPVASSWSAAATSAWRWPRPSSAGAPRSRWSRAPTSSWAPSTPTWPSACSPRCAAWASTCGSTREVAGFEPGQVLARRRRMRSPPTSSCSASASRPTASWPATPAPTTGARGALVVDRRQRTTLDGVYAAGDCCESHHLVSGPPDPRRARHRRQQAGPGGGHQPRRRLRHLPRRRRHGDHQGVHRRGRAHRPHRAGGGGGGLRGRRRPPIEAHHHRRLPARRQADDGEAGGRARHRPAARRPDRRARTGRPSGSTRSPPRCTPACASTS